MNTLKWIICLLLLAHGTCLAQKKIPIEVALKADDAVAPRVAEELSSAIRTAHHFLIMPELLPTSVHAGGLRLTTELAQPRIKLQLVGPQASAAGAETPIAAYIVYDSVDMPLGGAFIRSVVEMCTIETARSCASRILHTADRSIEWLRVNWPSLWKTL